MATIIIGSYMVRYPLGGNLSWALQYLTGFNQDYIHNCKGEFSVCKNVYTATCSGWFSDKSAAYMASGRPVVLQETGFSKHLPVGAGLFAVNNAEEAKNALDIIQNNYDWHCHKAWEIVTEYLESKKVLANFLNTLGL